jgi:hypothetical protein
MGWYNAQSIPVQAYTCGYCGNVVAPDKGYHLQENSAYRVAICPSCNKPSYVTPQEQVPGVAPGNEVRELPPDIGSLYREARNAVAASAHTAATLVCRKLLMNIAVAEGAPPGKAFIEYVEYLANQGYVPPKGKGWVDHIRKKGNEATHEIVVMTRADAEELVAFTEMLLKFIFEFPSRVPKTTP